MKATSEMMDVRRGNSLSPKLVSLLQSVVTGPVLENASLANISRWKIGGPARVFVEPASSKEVADVMKVMSDRPEPLFIMGDSSNILFDSLGFFGVVMRVGRKLSRMSIQGCIVKAEAGIWVPQFTRNVGSKGLSGAEHTIGIPGTLGGLILMNGGSQRKGIGLNVVRVSCVDRSGSTFELTKEECGFSYRTSNLQKLNSVILDAELEFSYEDPRKIRREMLEIMRARREKFPKNLPNCGSTFLSDPAMYATVGPPGRAIEDAGLKGTTIGGAQVSPLHANFIINTGQATSSDILSLIKHIREKVHERTGYWLGCEVRHVTSTGEVRPAHESAP